MTYKITYYTRRRARVLGVAVRRSTKKNKKIDIIKNGKVVASVGDSRYKDYPSLIRTEGKEKADKRRRLYKMRHNKYRHKKGTPSYYADQLLW